MVHLAFLNYQIESYFQVLEIILGTPMTLTRWIIFGKQDDFISMVLPIWINLLLWLWVSVLLLCHAPKNYVRNSLVILHFMNISGTLCPTFLRMYYKLYSIWATIMHVWSQVRLCAWPIASQVLNPKPFIQQVVNTKHLLWPKVTSSTGLTIWAVCTSFYFFSNTKTHDSTCDCFVIEC